MKTEPNEPINGELLFQPMGNEYDGTTCVGQFTRGGLTKREWFAGLAMQGLIAKTPLFDRKGEHGIAAPSIKEIHGIRHEIAQSAVDYADALIAQLNKEKV